MLDRTHMVIFSNTTAYGPYKCDDVQFNHANHTCTFRNLETRKRETIDIDEIDYITIQTVDNGTGN